MTAALDIHQRTQDSAGTVWPVPQDNVGKNILKKSYGLTSKPRHSRVGES